mgnify:CR=1 FL=1
MKDIWVMIMTITAVVLLTQCYNYWKDLEQICNSYVFYRWTIDDLDICGKYQNILNP